MLRRQYWVPIAALGLLVFDLCVRALHSPLITDELMARLSAQTPSLWTLLRLLREQPMNFDAPVFPVLAFGFAHLPIPIDFAIRIPSMIAMCVAIVALFCLVRDWLGFGAALLAAEFLAVSPHAHYGAIGRPYSLLLAAVAISLLSWHRATQATERRPFWIAALGISATLAFLTQYFAIFALCPIAVAEIVRSFLRRNIDWPIWAAFAAAGLVAAPVYAAYLPAGEIYRAHPFLPLNTGQLVAAFRDTVSFFIVFAVVVSALVLKLLFGAGRQSRHLRGYEWIAAAAFALYPFLAFYVAGRHANTFSSRYGMCAVLGVAILLSALMNFVTGGSLRILIAVFVISFSLGQLWYFELAPQPAFSPSSAWAKSTPDLLNRYPDLALVTPDFDFAMRTRLYGPAWLVSRLTMITNPESMVRFAGNDNAALAALAIHRWTNWPLVDYFQFRRTHDRFLMYGEYWMYAALKAEGAKIQMLGQIGPYNLYLVEASKS